MFGPQFRVVDVSGTFEESTSIQTISIELSNPFSSNYGQSIIRYFNDD